MTDLKELFEERDRIFAEKTNKIFSLISNTLEAVTIFLTDIDDLVAQGTITWEDANIVEDLVVLIGMVQYEIGSTITIADQQIEVTEENVDNFQRIVHMSVPLEKVLEDDKDALLEFLYSMNIEKEIDEFSSVLDENGEEITHEFDLSELDEEQQKQLKYFESLNKKQ